MKSRRPPDEPTNKIASQSTLWPTHSNRRLQAFAKPCG
nr:MAG TPA: hypothetical protein [Caudoviricetes sp.]